MAKPSRDMFRFIDDNETIPGVRTAPPPAPRDPAAHSPAHWIKVSPQADGTFTVTNPRNGFSKTYRRNEPLR